MFQNVVFYTGIGQRARGIDAHRFQFARHQFHGGNSALADARGEAGAIGELGPLTPQPKPHRVCQIIHVCSTGSRGVDNPGLGQAVLKLDPGDALL